MPTIHVKFNGSTKGFDFEPVSQPINLNANATIQWVLTGQQMPAQSSVRFPATGAIAFKSGYNWPGSTPAIDPSNSSMYTATDSNAPGQQGDFPYTTTVTFTDANGNSQTYSYDPDVDNLGTPIKTCISHGVAVGV
jgi:hypothetical protein